MEGIFKIVVDTWGEQEEVGYFTSKKEAKAYCDWRNQYSEFGAKHFSYKEEKLMSLEEEKKKYRVYFKVEMNGCGEVEECYPFLSEVEEERVSVIYLSEKVTDYIFVLRSENEDKVIQQALKLIKEIEFEYEKTKDWNEAVKVVNGTARSRI